nr:hypothetical protein [Nanoarchaeota archaeon]
MIRNEKRAKRNGRILTATAWTVLASSILGLYLYNKTPDMSQKKAKENTVLVQESDLEKYVNQITKFIDERYSIYNHGKTLNSKRKKEIATYVYEAANEFDVPLRDYMAIISKESRFTNKLGDLKYLDKENPSKSDHSEGYIQMRINTQRWVFKKMKKEGIKGLPDKLPGSIIPFIRLQFRMSAWYFKHCLEKSNGNIEEATSKYNRGHNSDKQNKEYLRRVKEEKKIINDYMSPSL